MMLSSLLTVLKSPKASVLSYPKSSRHNLCCICELNNLHVLLNYNNEKNKSISWYVKKKVNSCLLPI